MSIGRFALMAAAAAAMILASCDSADTPPAQAPQAAQRINDLASINEALQNYHTANGAYPVSDHAQGFASNWGASLGADWIPELDQQPRDPALSDAADGPQYLYISDGVDYKLIAHASGDCGPEIETQGVRIDPRRQNEGGCWAYGFWSAGGAAF